MGGSVLKRTTGRDGMRVKTILMGLTIALMGCAKIREVTMHADMKACREEILGQLKSPSTAQFSDWTRYDDAFMRRFAADQLKEKPTGDEWDREQGKRYRSMIDSPVDVAQVHVTVDAQNSYGAMIRSNWSCYFGAWQHGEYQLGKARDASGNRIDSTNQLWNYRTIVYTSAY
jgi:hypothetical protein